MLIVRYGIGGVMVMGGIVTLILSPAGLGVDRFAIAVGGGLSILLLNFMYRLRVRSELDREREERARAYFDEHGDRPEDEPDEPWHKWALPAGAVTFEQELARQAAGDSIEDCAPIAARSLVGIEPGQFLSPPRTATVSAPGAATLVPQTHPAPESARSAA